MKMDEVEELDAEPVMTTDDMVSRILGLASFCAAPGKERQEQAARGRGWLDSQGMPTAEGRALIEELANRGSNYGLYRFV